MNVYRRGGVTPLILSMVLKMEMVSFMLNRKECLLLIKWYHLEEEKWGYDAEITFATKI
jgi:hypothetical protein